MSHDFPTNIPGTFELCAAIKWKRQESVALDCKPLKVLFALSLRRNSVAHS